MLCWGTGDCTVGLFPTDHMKISVLEIPYLKPLTDSERSMEQLVARMAARQSAPVTNLPLLAGADRTGKVDLEPHEPHESHESHELINWILRVQHSLMPILSALAKKGVPADTLAALLPYTRHDRFIQQL